MKEDLENKLYQDFPTLFRVGKLPSGIYIGVGDGWYDIIRTTSRCIEWHIKNLPEATKIVEENDFYEDEINNLLAGDKLYIRPQFSEIKQKYGQLRIYINNQDPYISGVISMAEEISGRICEGCGVPSKIQKDKGWLSTLCGVCREI
jgi:hypothetical protein